MQRIVSLVPSQTELLADLGLEDEVVGITKFCIHPKEWFRNKTRIGGTKTIDIEKIKSLKPDLILANKEENVKEQILALEQIAPVYVSDIQTLGEALDMIATIGTLCGKSARAKEIVVEIQNQFQNLHQAAQRSVAYCIWREPWMWVGKDTFIHDVLIRAGFKNVFAEVPRYPVVGLDALRAKSPEYIFLSSEPYPFKEKHKPEVQKIFPESKIILVDGELFSWYGSRLLQTPEYLTTLIKTL
ncbi:MAG: ABC transporter substrate-binding protein [Bacteroidetes bacterium]|nr:ABC transporter substrate-binding protein [Bacteroidota bacterium]